MKLWKDITQDKSGRYVAKDVFKVVSFGGGYGIVIAAAVSDYLAGRGVGLGGAIALLTLAFGIQVNKDWASLAYRKVEVEAACETPEPSTPEVTSEPEKQVD